ncbi:MAG: hypothetical protein J5767_15235 [Paludibacteraceae bacterium]|nr:hypothetical protein [Paludibacteraceae bacterium]
MKKLFILIVGLLFLACGKSIKVTDLQYKVEKWSCYVYQNGEPFDGEAWSEDGKSYKATVDCGILKKIEYYDESGKLFCVVENEEKKFYNEKGTEITRDQVRELYWDKYNHWKYDQQAKFREVAMNHPKTD